MTEAGLNSILICGRGLAFELTIAALSKNLPSSLEVKALETPDHIDRDAFYGSATSPLAYDFFISVGVDEPSIFQNTDTTFSYGTHYQNWADNLDWVQSHHLSFPVWNNIQFHHFLRKYGKSLEPYLVNAVAGRAGAFAHPPNDKNIPLARAEYGYQCRPHSLADYLKAKSDLSKIKRLNGAVRNIGTKDGRIESVELEDGQVLRAQFFIDATGQDSLLMSALDSSFSTDHTLGVSERLVVSDAPTGALRELHGKEYGWQSTTHLQATKSLLTVFHPDDKQLSKSDQYGDLLSEFKINLGHRDNSWTSNCVAVGHSSSVVEPLTPAPLMLLQLDIQRLMELTPVSIDMSVEEKEFNRLARLDFDHSQLFTSAFFETADNPDTNYWRAARAQEPSDKLARKISQFKSRGFLTAFDFEPFNEQDWTILHFGMNRSIDRIDPFLDNIPDVPIRERLDQLELAIKQIVGKMPPHQRYLDKFLNYLERKHAE